MHWPTTTSLIVFVGIVGFVIVGVIAAFVISAQPGRKVRDGAITTVVLLAWLALTGGISASGVFHVPEPFPRMAPYALTCLVAAFALGLSPLGRRLADGVPIGLLVGFHGFRFPLELVLHSWADQGTIPADLAFDGQNFDIVPGVLALLVAPFAKRVPWLVLIFEVLGAAMLLNILRIVGRNVPGSPLFFEHGEPPLLLPAYVPTTWIVSFCVMFAVAGHVVIGVWLWRRWLGRGPVAPA